MEINTPFNLTATVCLPTQTLGKQQITYKQLLLGPGNKYLDFILHECNCKIQFQEPSTIKLEYGTSDQFNQAKKHFEDLFSQIQKLAEIGEKFEEQYDENEKLIDFATWYEAQPEDQHDELQAALVDQMKELL
ncbi:K_Homology domain [Hexamita inflata]|uniref:Type 1 superfamily n=1 Tax=Hexamita inflata TaxID=28002 RepID=A0AA86NWH3_9EUKA|nr:K Homology domain [Hexamita inflata]